MCDEHCRHLGNCDHGSRAFAESPEHGQCWHHSMAFQRVDVLCWVVRDVLHRAGAGSRRLAAPSHRAQPVPGGARHAGAHRLVLHLPDGRVRGRTRRRVRTAAVVPHHAPDGRILRRRSGLRVLPPGHPRNYHSGQRVRLGLLPGHRISRPARHRRPHRLYLPAGAHHDEQVHSGASHRSDRRVLLLALRRHRVDRPVRHHLLRPMSSVEKQSMRRGSMTSKSRRRMRRRLSAGLLLMIALAVAGGLAAVLTPTPQVAVADESQQALLRTGKQLFETSCVSCHGANLQGVPDRGPSLIGTGDAAVYFQVSTGRMPAMRDEAQAPRKAISYDEHQIDAIGAYVQANGGGPSVPRDANGQVAQDSLIGSDVARGGDLFRLNCASCHNFTGKGGALSSGKYAPELDEAEPAQIFTAMLTGPQNMPRFSDRQLTPDEKKDIVAYVRQATNTPDPGGYGLGGFGPAPEGMAAWIIGMVAVIGVALWVGSRS